MPLVLASNDANASNQYSWRDITGVQYHYPNGYRNLIRPGERFIYYRGIRRANGARGEAEYFGCGKIGETRRDPDVPIDAPKKNWAWLCDVEEYFPFTPPVPAKVNGAFYEHIKPNMWRNGVRKLSDAIFDQIMSAAGTSPGLLKELPEVVNPRLPDIAEVRIEETPGELLAPRARVPKDSDVRSNGQTRRSRNAKIVGGRAEAIAIRHIRESVDGATDVRHVSEEGETPGWDIEYKDRNGELHAVEVKGTSGAAFPSFEFTSGELNAARKLGPCYWVYLISDCLSENPKLQRMRDPARLLENGALSAEPTVWRVQRK